MNLPEVVILMCTYNRHILLERVVGCFLDQDYKGKATMVILNTGAPITVDKEYDNIILTTSSSDFITHQPYTNVGDQYRDALITTPWFEIISHMSDDDYFLPNYISAGVVGLLKATENGYSAYKPQKSWFRSGLETVSLDENVHEPSIFMLADVINTTGFLKNSVKFHDGWLHPLIKSGKIFVDSEGIPTFVYDWSGEHPAFKLSGRGTDDDKNYQDARAFKGQENDGILTPLSHKQLQKYYDLVNNSC